MKEFIAKGVQQLRFKCNNFSIILWFWLSVADLKIIQRDGQVLQNMMLQKLSIEVLEAMPLKKKIVTILFHQFL